MLRTIVAAAIAIGAAASREATAAPASLPVPDIQLAPHTAQYDLSLASTTDGNTVAATGSMSFKVIDACQNLSLIHI